MNFFEPISKCTVECGWLISWKSDSENSRSPVARPFPSHSSHQFGVVAHVDDAEGVVLGPQPQGHFAGHALQVLDIEPAAAGGVEERCKRFIEDLRRRESASVEVREAPRKQVLARSGDKALVENPFDALDAAGAISHIAVQEL